MIYFFHGEDAVRAKQKIRKLTDALLSKRPEAVHFYFDDQTLDNDFLKGIYRSAGLFSEHHIVVLDRVFYVLESKDAIESMKESEHVFILFEDKLQKEDLKYLQKNSEKSEEFIDQKLEKKDSRKNFFALTDAVCSGDKKKSWMLYRELIDDGTSAEEIQPMLFWQIKTMLMASESKDAGEAGLKPFVFTKGRRGTERYGKERVKELSRKIVNALYGSRQGKNLENELEKILLAL